MNFQGQVFYGAAWLAKSLNEKYSVYSPAQFSSVLKLQRRICMNAVRFTVDEMKCYLYIVYVGQMEYVLIVKVALNCCETK